MTTTGKPVVVFLLPCNANRLRLKVKGH